MENKEFVLFGIAGVVLALPLDIVREVVPAAALGGVHDDRQVIMGILNLRGQLIPVLTLRRVFGIADVPLQPDQYIAIVEYDGRTIGMLVDSLQGLRDISHNAVQRAPEVPYRHLLSGALAIDSAVVLIPDLAALAERIGIQA